MALRYSQFAPILEEKLDEVRNTKRERNLTGSQKARINRFLGEIPELKQTLERLIDIQVDSPIPDTNRLEHLLDLFQQLESIEDSLNFEVEPLPSTPLYVNNNNNNSSGSNDNNNVFTTATTTTTTTLYQNYPAPPAEHSHIISQHTPPSASSISSSDSSEAEDVGQDFVLLDVGRVPDQQEAGNTPLKPTEQLEYECPICGTDTPADECLMLQCSHVYCKTCMESYFLNLMNDGRLHNVVCPDPSCKAEIADTRVQAVLPEKEFQKFSRHRLLTCYQREPNCRWCPRPDCETPMIGDPGHLDFPMLTCFTCDMQFCFHCVKPWHEGKCEKNKGSKGSDKAVKKLCKKMNWAECPKCNVFIEKTAGCLLITCFCGCMFCYKCKSVALNQYTATCACQPGHRFLSLAELGRDRPYGDGQPDPAPTPSYFDTLDDTIVREIEQIEKRQSKEKGWNSFRKKVKLGLLGLKNGLVGIVLFSKPSK